MDKENITVFALDDDAGDLEIFRRFLEEIPLWEVDFNGFTQWEQFRTEVARRVGDVLFLDYCLGPMNGIDAVGLLRKSGENRPIIVLTGQGDEKIAAQIIRAGADDYLVKRDLTPDLVRRAISNAMAQFRAKEEKAVLEKQLQEAQKMETLGALAGGIAHDFNNLLMAIMGYADFAKMKSKGREVEADLDNIIVTSKQMAKLVRQLLSFSRREKDKMEPIDLTQVLVDAVNILKHTLPKNVSLDIVTPDHHALILSNSSLLSQVILNLCINAAEAMPEGGKITIRHRPVDVTGDVLLTHPNLCEGQYVLLEIRDTGKGMTEETRQRIFEPFFTTKQMGAQKGTGLGLSIVWNNLKKMKGVVDVYSEINNGTVFKVYLPVGQKRSKPYVSPDVKDVVGNGETVLVVDDEKLVLSLVSKLLSRLNYKVYAASNGLMALDMFKSLKDEIDLVILDISMPEMGGRECIKGMRAVSPQVKVIFSSGHDLTGSADELKRLGCSGLIQKPYFLTDLGKRIKSVLHPV